MKTRRGARGKEEGNHRTIIVRYGRFGVRAAQRWASIAPLARSIDGTTRQHGMRMKNAPSLRPRQRRQLQAMLGGWY